MLEWRFCTEEQYLVGRTKKRILQHVTPTVSDDLVTHCFKNAPQSAKLVCSARYIDEIISVTEVTRVKSSAVAEMGDHGHNRHGQKREGGCCAPIAESWDPV